MLDAPRPPGGDLDPPKALTPFQQHVVEVVSAIPAGEIATYGEVAIEAGHPGTAQAVANVLRRIPDLPWWRVVPTSLRLYRTHAPVQAPLLRAEGIVVDEQRHVRPATSHRALASPTPGRRQPPVGPKLPARRWIAEGASTSSPANARPNRARSRSR